MGSNGRRGPQAATEERRGHARHGVDRRVSWWQQHAAGGQLGKQYSGWLLDIGHGGFCLWGGGRATAGDTVEYLLTIDDEMILLRGRVAWSAMDRGKPIVGVEALVDERLLRAVGQPGRASRTPPQRALP